MRPDKAVMEAIRSAGGRPMIVGGWVRDHLLGIESKDLDIEVLGMDAATLESVLARFGKVNAIGRAFGVFKLGADATDYSLPRADSKVSPGHRGFAVEVDPGLDFAQAARRRDLTINAIGMDAVTGEIVDPHGGREDLAARRLRATDETAFSEDPLRGLRVAQLGARLAMRPDPTLVRLCRALDLSEIAGERIGEEMTKLLVRAERPSLGLAILEETELLRFMPELDALRGVEQDPQWHPEGDVWTHTLMVVDEAAKLRTGTADDLVLMLGALCHDLGKPATTEHVDGRVRARAHEEAGVAPTETLLERWRMRKATSKQVQALVAYHLAPAVYPKNRAKRPAYKRLVRKLAAAGTTPEMLERVARADQMGRTTEEALTGRFDAGAQFLERAREKEIVRDAANDAVKGRHLIAEGMTPGPAFRTILDRCREVQDETGWTDPKAILARARAEEEVTQ